MQLSASSGLARSGQVEASRGCLHRCRHCPLPPIYGGRFFIVPPDIVLSDIRNQVKAGARHITFADADFLNGPGHVMPIVAAMHDEFPDLTFDFTAKVSHLLGDPRSVLAGRRSLFVHGRDPTGPLSSATDASHMQRTQRHLCTPG